MAKYFVVVEPGNGTFWHSDKACKILHREDGPAVEWANSFNYYYLRNVEFLKEQFDVVMRVIRETPDELPTDRETYYVHVDDYGTIRWYKDEECTIAHRGDDAPAIEYKDGNKYWMLDGKNHRVCGPSFNGPDGDDQYWLHGVKITEEQFNVFAAMQDDLIDTY